jgi:uncharacterized protein (TIGR03000 family)
MLRSVLPVSTALALAVCAPHVAPGPAMAQQGSWYSGTDGYGRSTSGWSSGYGGGSSYSGSIYYSTPTYYASPTPTYWSPSYYSTPTYAYSTPTYYPAPGQVPSTTYAAPESNSYLTAAEVKGPRAAQIDVHLPAGATIWFDDNPTSQTGVLRHFESPPLAPDTDYSYRVTVRWQEGGQDVTRTRKVEVHAGDRLNLTFGPSVGEAARR